MQCARKRCCARCHETSLCAIAIWFSALYLLAAREKVQHYCAEIAAAFAQSTISGAPMVRSAYASAVERACAAVRASARNSRARVHYFFLPHIRRRAASSFFILVSLRFYRLPPLSSFAFIIRHSFLSPQFCRLSFAYRHLLIRYRPSCLLYMFCSPPYLICR